MVRAGSICFANLRVRRQTSKDFRAIGCFPRKNPDSSRMGKLNALLDWLEVRPKFEPDDVAGLWVDWRNSNVVTIALHNNVRQGLFVTL